MTAKSTFPEWIYDGSEIADPFGYGERAVTFLRRLKHPKSTLPKKAFQLDRWQERVVRAIYGPRHDDGRRIVNTVVMLLPRGNRKTRFLVHRRQPPKPADARDGLPIL